MWRITQLGQKRELIDNKKSINTHSYLKWSQSRSVLSDSLQPIVLSVHGILQARILKWVAFPFSRGSSQHTEYYFKSICWLQMKKYVTTEYFHDSLKKFLFCLIIWWNVKLTFFLKRISCLTLFSYYLHVWPLEALLIKWKAGWWRYVSMLLYPFSYM